jgi:hypothetical protein
VPLRKLARAGAIVLAPVAQAAARNSSEAQLLVSAIVQPKCVVATDQRPTARVTIDETSLDRVDF